MSFCSCFKNNASIYRIYEVKFVVWLESLFKRLLVQPIASPQRVIS